MPYTVDVQYIRPDQCLTLSCVEFGHDDVGRAAQICNAHQDYNGPMTQANPPPLIPKFMKGWEACKKVWSEWLVSEEGRKKAEAEVQEQRELDFVNEVAKGLRK